MKYAIIPAAGAGTRMKELGKNYAKTVLPFEGKPIIVHIIEGINEEVAPDEVIVVYGNEEHRQQLQEVLDAYGIGATLRPVLPIGRVGPAQSIVSGIPRDVTDDDSLFIHLSDFVAVDRSALGILPDTIAAFSVSDQHRWCMVKQLEHGLVFFDKPKDRVETDLAVAGLYHISNARDFLFSYLYNTNAFGGESQISEVLSAYSGRHPLRVEEIATDSLKDFGTIEEFIQNRGISKTRSFNQIFVEPHVIRKASADHNKIRSEYHWYITLPYEMQRFTPRVYSCTKNTNDPIATYMTYSMERLKSTNLRDLYLYLDRSEGTWDEVFASVFEFVELSKQDVYNDTSFWEFFMQKNRDRISGTSYEEEGQLFLGRLEKQLRNSRFYRQSTVYHGDMHFANMFYCFHYKQLKLIDPNGRHVGHWLYDIAKLNHSVNGKYDWIDAELYHSQGFLDRGCDGVKLSFASLLCRLGLADNPEELSLLNNITASLFLSMIPLHDHSPRNQELFLAEFRRLSAG